MSSINVPITLPSGPPVRSDHERALERIFSLEKELAESEAERQMLDGERDRARAETKKRDAEITALRSQRRVLMDSERALNAQLHDSEEERLKACEDTKNTQLRLDESLAREGDLNQRLSNLDILAREITERVGMLVKITEG